MPYLQDLLDELLDAGVVIAGDMAPVREAGRAEDWPTAILDLTMRGRKAGLQFLRQGPDRPTDDQLHRIVAGYPFTAEQANLLVQNIIGQVAA